MVGSECREILDRKMLSVFEGTVAFVIGLVLIVSSRPVSRLYSDHPRLTGLLMFDSVKRFWSREDVIRISRIFWIVCGTLWVLSGLALIIGLTPAIRIPR